MSKMWWLKFLDWTLNLKVQMQYTHHDGVFLKLLKWGNRKYRTTILHILLWSLQNCCRILLLNKSHVENLHISPKGVLSLKGWVKVLSEWLENNKVKINVENLWEIIFLEASYNFLSYIFSREIMMVGKRNNNTMNHISFDYSNNNHKSKKW